MPICSPLLFEKEGKPFLISKLLPAASGLLPSPVIDKSGKPLFKDEILDNYNQIMLTMQEIQTLFMLESEQVLQMTARISDLNTAMVERFLG